MCNEAARRISLDELRVDWSELKIPLRFPEGAPNFQPTDSIRITDPAPILRAAPVPSDEAGAGGEGAGTEDRGVEMVTRRWSWPAPSGKPVYNYRSDGREFRNGRDQGRCLIPIDAFYEFTDAEAADPPAGKAKKRPPKTKWAFRMAGLRWFCVAGLWRSGVRFKDGTTGEAWTMLTCPPGPDIAPYHDRQIVLLGPADYARWLDGSAPAAALCRPLPAGSLEVERVR